MAGQFFTSGTVRGGVAVALAVGLIGAATGCKSAARVINDEGGDIRSETVWVYEAPQLEVPPPPQRSAYLEVQNNAGIDAEDLTADLKTYIQDAGYLLLRSPDEAHFKVLVTLQSFGRSETADGGISQLTDLGAIAGAASEVTDAGGRELEGYLAREASIDAQTLASGSRFSPAEWALVVDTVIQEQLDEPVQFVVAESGPATTSRVFPHGSRVLVYARQIGLIESEGLSVIKAKLREAMRTVLP